MKKLISWVEIPATDFDRAVDFYSTIFNLTFEKLDFGEEKMACFPGGEGAISKAPGFEPAPHGVLVSFTAAGEITALLEKVKQHGGKVETPKTKIEAEGRGYFALILDSEGNKIGLYED